MIGSYSCLILIGQDVVMGLHCTTLSRIIKKSEEYFSPDLHPGLSNPWRSASVNSLGSRKPDLLSSFIFTKAKFFCELGNLSYNSSNSSSARCNHNLNSTRPAPWNGVILYNLKSTTVPEFHHLLHRNDHYGPKKKDSTALGSGCKPGNQ